MKFFLLVNILLFGMSFGLYADGAVDLKKACDNGDIKKCYKLGHMYRDGINVKRNYASAIKYYSKVCDGGYAAACNNLGVRFINGQGTKKDNMKAMELFHKACDDGDLYGCDNREIVKRSIIDSKIH